MKHAWQALLFAIALVAALVVTTIIAPGPKHHKATVKPPIARAQAKAVAACPLDKHHLRLQRDIHGKLEPTRSMGICTPPIDKAIARGLPSLGISGEQGPDLSNNDPTTNWGAIRAHGHRYGWVKVSEGTSFRDPWAAPMAAAGRRAGVIVGGYIFSHVCMVSPIAEAQLGVDQLRNAGLVGPNSAAPVLDVEYGGCGSGVATNNYIRAERDYIANALHTRVDVYSGNWWLAPHTACLFASLPSNTLSWISGYPNAAPPCGHPLNIHQFTDAAFNGANTGDMSVLVNVSVDQLRQQPGPPPVPSNIIALNDRIKTLWGRRNSGHLQAYGKHDLDAKINQIYHLGWAPHVSGPRPTPHLEPSDWAKRDWQTVVNHWKKGKHGAYVRHLITNAYQHEHDRFHLSYIVRLPGNVNYPG